MGLVSVAPKPNTSRPAREHKIYPYLLDDRPPQPGVVYRSDLHPAGPWILYLTAVMDWHSRYVLSWEVSVTMEENACISALESALRRHPKPEIFNSDQGSQFTGQAFTGVLKDQAIQISMDGKGRAMDNIMVERLCRSVKYEEIYLKEYRDVQELVQSLKTYFEFYNHQRPHSGLDGQTPAEVYWGQQGLGRAA